MQFEWLRAFWPTSQEQDFSQIKDLYRNTANNKDIHYKTNSVKINDQKLEKKLFLACFLNFGGKKSLPKKLGCHAQLHKGF